MNYPKTIININKKDSFNAFLFNNINNPENEIKTHKSTSRLPSLFDDHFEKRYNSKKNVLDNINSNRPRTKRYQTRKFPSKINKQLNIITKNIENTSNNINNPDIFYSNFFKSIIAKESQVMKSNTNSYNNTITPDTKKIHNKIGTNLYEYYLIEKSLKSSDRKEEKDSNK